MDHANDGGVTLGLKGFYRIEAECSITGKKRLLADWFPNLITNIGMDRMFTNTGNLISNCVVGAGTNPPLATDTQLQTFIGTTTNATGNNQTAQSSAPYYTAGFTTFQFAPGVATGNLSEVGVGWASNQLLSRSLIKDPGGNPITITVLATEYLNVVYEFRIYPQATDHVINLTTSSVAYTVTTRAVNITNAGNWSVLGFLLGGGLSSLPGINSVYNGPIGPITGVPSGTNVGSSGTVVWATAYVNGSYTRSATFSFSPTQANPSGGIGSVMTIAGGYMQTGFVPNIPKDTNKTFSFTMQYTLAVIP